MNETVIVMHTLKGNMHINNVLIELVSHTLAALFPIPYVQNKITTSRKYYMPSHSTVSLHKSITATRISQRHFFLQDKRKWMRSSEQ